jgi:hypothetical protein
MSGVEDDRVARAVEHAMQGNRELDYAEVRSEMPAAARHRADQHLADLRAQAGEILGAEVAQVGWAGDLLEQHGDQSS